MTTVGRQIARDGRARRYGHKGAIIWLTGLSGAGKSTLAMHAEARLFGAGYSTYVLDGDELRRGISADLGFSAEDRHENIRRAGEVAALIADAGLIVFEAMISPFSTDRAGARRVAGSCFREVFVRASLSAWTMPNVVIDTEQLDVETAVGQLVAYVADSVPLAEGASDGLTR